ncbi:hypothetical protein ACLOJK_002020 [Asimina triloba]
MEYIFLAVKLSNKKKDKASKEANERLQGRGGDPLHCLFPNGNREIPMSLFKPFRSASAAARPSLRFKKGRVQADTFSVYLMMACSFGFTEIGMSRATLNRIEYWLFCLINAPSFVSSIKSKLDSDLGDCLSIDWKAEPARNKWWLGLSMKSVI